MRIAMVGPFGFHPKKTMRSRAYRLARPLVARGHQVRMIMPPWHTPDEANREWEESGVEIRYASLSGGVLATSLRMVRETLAWNPDVVHTFKPKAYSGMVAWWLWTFRRKGVCLVTDTDDWEGKGGWNDLAPYNRFQKTFFSWQELWGLRHNHALTVASRTLESLAWANGVAEDRVHYLPNGPGIDHNARNQGEIRKLLGLNGRPSILLYSRLFEFDTSRLLSVLAGVKSELPDLAILRVGRALDQEQDLFFKKKLKDHDLEMAIIDAGWQDENILPGYLAAGDVGLYLMDDTLLNRAKCPVKLADMLALGIPIVAEAVGQVSEYVRNEDTGLLRQSGDTDGLISDLIRLLEDAKLQNRFSSNSKAYMSRYYSWSLLADKVESIYRNCSDA